jgi:Polyketide cyclase / dehydrase and lipid transport
MASHDYRFVTHWRVEGTPEEVFRILDEPLDLPRWWPAVWLKVEQVEPGDARGIGRVTRMTTKGWLPYILHWTARTADKGFPRRIVLEATGDFNGRGVWTLSADGDLTDVEYAWEVRADKPLLRHLSFVFRWVFTANHKWAMARGEESLRLELARRRAGNDGERARVPVPPPPVFLGRRTRRRLGLPPP